MDDLKGIAFRLQPLGLVSFESLAGDTLETKSRAIVAWSMQHDFMSVLAYVIRKERPDITV